MASASPDILELRQLERVGPSFALPLLSALQDPALSRPAYYGFFVALSVGHHHLLFIRLL